MYKLTVYLLFALIPIVSFGQRGFSDKANWAQKILADSSLSTVKSALNEAYILKKDKSAIPKGVIQILQKWSGEAISFANPNEEYNETDIVDNTLPSRQLISVYSNRSFLFVLYNHGGFGFHRHIIWCKLRKNEITDLWICNYNDTILNMNELKNFFHSFTRIHKLNNGKQIKENYLCY